MTDSLARAPRNLPATVATIDWSALAPHEVRRLREFGLLEGVEVTPLHRGSLFSRDPLALSVGRMRVIIRARQAAMIAVEAIESEPALP